MWRRCDSRSNQRLDLEYIIYFFPVPCLASSPNRCTLLICCGCRPTLFRAWENLNTIVAVPLTFFQYLQVDFGLPPGLLALLAYYWTKKNVCRSSRNEDRPDTPQEWLVPSLGNLLRRISSRGNWEGMTLHSPCTRTPKRLLRLPVGKQRGETMAPNPGVTPSTPIPI